LFGIFPDSFNHKVRIERIAAVQKSTIFPLIVALYELLQPHRLMLIFQQLGTFSSLQEFF
ncbi:MAG: hypothetical protein VX004_11680, partial [SAR324 cluster bacterium]|nr:hypothetical protein [SAR324 cluster bacterium]